MPKVTKDAKTDELNKKKTTTKKSSATPKKKTTNSSKSTKNKVANKSSATKTTKSKATSTTKNNTTTRKKAVTTSKDKSTPKKKTTTKTKKIEPNIVAEYYDLPYRYNETIVKILYQTPTILYVYWDISDYDRENFVRQYGENFFNNTKPILKIYNLTKNYDFEIEINDFANSWYINVNDANCEYKVELARRTIKYEENINTDYIYISSSNYIEFPNDHILLDELPNKINFRNVKTNTVTIKDISTMHLIGINKIYKAHDFYKTFYKDEILKEITNNLSSSWS